MDKTKTLVTTLIVIIAVMALVLVYVFLIGPSLTGYAVDRQVEGYQIAVFDIAQQAATCQPVTLNLGENEEGEPQSISLIAIECLQLPQGSEGLEDFDA